MVLYYSRPWAIFKILLFTALMAAMAQTLYFLVAAASPSPNALAKGTLVFSAPYLLIYFYLIWGSVKALRWRDPVLVFDETGITDARHGDKLIPWRDIASTYLGQDGNQACLVVKFTSLAAAKRNLGAWRMPSALLNRVIMFGEWCVILGPLKFKSREVVAKADELLAYSRRRA